MKISRTRGDRSRVTAPAESWQAGRAPATAFSDALMAQQGAMHAELLDAMYDTLAVMADELDTTSPLLQWEAFRDLVLEYLAEVKNGYRLKKRTVWDQRGNQRLLVLVEEANEELVSLGIAFLQREGDKLQFLARVKRLKGLLLDMKS